MNTTQNLRSLDLGHCCKWVSFILGGFFLFWSKFRFIFSSNKLIKVIMHQRYPNFEYHPLSDMIGVISGQSQSSPARCRQSIKWVKIISSPGSRTGSVSHTTLCFCQLTLSAYTSKRAGIFYPFPIDFLLPICKKTLI